MKIIHVYSRNLDVFEDAIKGTGCCLNGSYDFSYMRKSFSNFNARDVLGFIIFQQHITKKTLKLIKTYDEYYIFSPRPLIIICDEAEELYVAKKVRVKNSPLYLIDSVDGTISDIDLKRVFTTIVCEAGDMYDLRDVEEHHNLVRSSHRDRLVLTGEASEVSSVNSTLQSVDEVMKIFRELGVIQ